MYVYYESGQTRHRLPSEVTDDDILGDIQNWIGHIPGHLAITDQAGAWRGGTLS